MGKTAFIGLRVDDSQKKQLSELSKKKGMTLTAYIFYLLKCDLDREEEQKLRDVKRSEEEKNLGPIKKTGEELILEILASPKGRDHQQ